MEKYKGCKKDCFNCPYSDCIAPPHIAESRLSDEEPNKWKIKKWTEKEDELIRSLSNRTLKAVAEELDVPDWVLRNHLKEKPDLRALFKSKPEKIRSSVVNYVTVHPGCTIDDVAAFLGKTRGAAQILLWQMQKANMISVESGSRWKKTTIWLKN